MIIVIKLSKCEHEKNDETNIKFFNFLISNLYTPVKKSTEDVLHPNPIVVIQVPEITAIANIV